MNLILLERCEYSSRLVGFKHTCSGESAIQNGRKDTVIPSTLLDHGILFCLRYDGHSRVRSQGKALPSFYPENGLRGQIEVQDWVTRLLASLPRTYPPYLPKLRFRFGRWGADATGRGGTRGFTEVSARSSEYHQRV